MIRAALLLQMAAAGLESPPPLPSDWSELPTLGTYRRMPPAGAFSAFVRDEVRAGRCEAAEQQPGGYRLPVELAVLVAADGSPRRVMPKAIGCPTVEQYASGLASRMVRDNVPPPGNDTWYRTSITFAWAD